LVGRRQVSPREIVDMARRAKRPTERLAGSST
jgi:hypothetical protein